MPTERFWSLIERTLPFEADTRKQSASLKQTLGELPPDEIEAFEFAFNLQLLRSYSWDLWGATYIVHGGASDDAFEYFRRWLISKGQIVFEQVLADPDSLADLLADDLNGVLEYEEFAYVARDAWAAKTGKSRQEFACGDYPHYPVSGPTGTKFSEDDSLFAKRYPKLWQRFGRNPLF